MIGLGRDVDRQFQVFKCLGNKCAVGGCTGEIAAKPDEGLGAAIQHCANRTQHVVAVFAWCGEAEFLFECIKEGIGGRPAHWNVRAPGRGRHRVYRYCRAGT